MQGFHPGLRTGPCFHNFALMEKVKKSKFLFNEPNKVSIHYLTQHV